MTKTTVICKDEQKELIPIEALACVQKNDGNLLYSTYDLNDSKELTIVKTNAYDKFDCVIINELGHVFVGKFNDGILKNK